jgi:hypothetical protein
MFNPNTQEEKILRYMFNRKGDNGKWFYAYHFNSPNVPVGHRFFVGYEASARMSDLKRKYKDLFEYRQDGRFRTMRINFKDLKKNLEKMKNKEVVNYIKSLI